MKNKIIIIDTGLDQLFINRYKINISMGINFAEQELSYSFNDVLGHGTGIVSIIHSIIPECEFIIFKIFGEKLEQSEEILLIALKKILELNIEFSIIHLSVGINFYSSELDIVCNKIYEHHNIIISAFDNAGCISYPASLKCVIGVEASDKCIRRSDFIFPQNEVVSIYAKGGFHRVVSSKSKTEIRQGNSLSAAYVTGYLAKAKLITYTNQEATCELRKISTYIDKGIVNHNNYFDEKFLLSEKEFRSISNIGIFPFNKETNSLIRYSKMLHFSIAGIYTSKLLGNLNTEISDSEKKQKYIIKSLESAEFEKIDTMVIGHLNKLEIFNQGIKDNILQMCYEKNVNVFSLDSDDLEKFYNKFVNKGLFLRCPSIVEKVYGKKGKLYKIKTPILGVLGTSSNQGKFSLQLDLKKEFEIEGYKVGYLCTEPTGILFGADRILPFGYEGIRDIGDFKFIDLVNTLLHEVDILNKDIIITGSQSRTIAQSANHLGHMAIKQMEYLMAIQPDVVLLCVNYNDEMGYIRKTIEVIENLTDAKVIGIAIYPLGFKSGWKRQNGKYDRIPIELLNEKKKNYLQKLIFQLLFWVMKPKRYIKK